MKTLKVLAIAIVTLGTVSVAKAQVGISINANFGRPNYLPIYTEPVYVERPVVYVERPVYVERRSFRRPVVYHRRAVVVNRPVVYRTNYRNDYRYDKHYKKHGRGHGNGRGHGHGRH